MADSVVQVKSLTKRYGKLLAVDSISFELRAGEVFSFLGPNGAGKTTTVEILECLRSPSEGDAWVLGFDVRKSSDQKAIRQRIGVLPQDFNALDKLTVKENVEYFASMFDHRLDADHLIKLVDLEDKRNELFKKLSGGLKQRVGLAVALVNDPEVVFLDEPTSGLDPKARRGVWSVIQSLKSEKKTIFLTTHYMDEAESLSDRIAVIDHGKIIANGPASELIDNHGGPKTLVVKGGGEFRELVSLDFPKAVSQPNGDLHIPIAHGEDLSSIVIALGGSRLGGRDVEIRRPSMDDVFLNLTGRKVTEEGELA